MREEGRTKRRRSRRAPGADEEAAERTKGQRPPLGMDAGKRSPEAAPAGPTELFRKGVALWPFIDDDWPEYRRAMPHLEPNRAIVAWLLRWHRSHQQIVDLTGLHRSTINYHVKCLLHDLGAAECRDVGPMAARLVDDLRRREGRLALEIPIPGPGHGSDGRAPGQKDGGRRPSPASDPGEGRAPPRS